MSAQRYVERRSSGLSLRWVALATTMLGTVLYGWFIGVIEVIESGRIALVTALGGLETFSGSLIYELLDGPAGVIETAWLSNAAFLESFGIAAFPIAMIEVVVVIYLLVSGMSILLRGVT